MAAERDSRGEAAVEIRVLAEGDEHVLRKAAAGVFDHEPRGGLATEFLADSRHHLVVAIAGETVVGFASALHYVHPDKEPQLWINEIGVAPEWQRQGIGSLLLGRMLELAGELDCSEIWVLTDATNEAAVALYRSRGGRPEPQVMFSFPGDGKARQ